MKRQGRRTVHNAVNAHFQNEAAKRSLRSLKELTDKLKADIEAKHGVKIRKDE